MSNDDMDRPTPKQSGSFGIMSDICKTSCDQLEAWLDHAPVGASEEIILTIQMARRLGREVASWEKVAPADDKKRETIENILKMREGAAKLAERYGHRLG